MVLLAVFPTDLVLVEIPNWSLKRVGKSLVAGSSRITSCGSLWVWRQQKKWLASPGGISGGCFRRWSLLTERGSNLIANVAGKFEGFLPYNYCKCMKFGLVIFSDPLCEFSPLFHRKSAFICLVGMNICKACWTRSFRHWWVIVRTRKNGGRKTSKVLGYTPWNFSTWMIGRGSGFLPSFFGEA